MKNALDKLCTAADAAKLLGVTPERTLQFCREGRLLARKLGREWVLWLPDVERLAKVPRPPGPKS